MAKATLTADRKHVELNASIYETDEIPDLLNSLLVAALKSCIHRPYPYQKASLARLNVMLKECLLDVQDHQAMNRQMEARNPDLAKL